MGFSNESVGHAFVYHENKKGSNFESEGNKLWSYSSILAMRNDGIIFIAYNIANYSSSSQRHASHLNKAIGWNTPQREKTVYVYSNIEGIINRDREHLKRELDYTVKAIQGLLLKQSRARTASYFDEIDFRIRNMQKILAYSKVDKRSTEYREFMKFSNIEDIRANYKDLIAQHSKDMQKKMKKEITKRHKKQYDKIKGFTDMTPKQMKVYSKYDLATYDFLRRRGSELCTSQNLCVNLREAQILYKMLVAGKDIIGKKISYFTILGYNETVVKIGCHNILRKELERVLA